VAALALLAAGCSGGGHGTSQVRPAAATGKASATAAAAAVMITPANGVTDADPSAGITVTATRGTPKTVTVHTSGDAVSGTLSQGGKVWHSQWALDVSQAYTMTATASGTGGGRGPRGRGSRSRGPRR
jgi:Bacterial Ig domain